MKMTEDEVLFGWRLVRNTPEAERLFTKQCLLKVHSVYHQVANITDGETIFAIHPAFLPGTPMSLVLDTAGRPMASLGLEPGMNVIFKETCMILNGICINSQNRSVWDPEVTVLLSDAEAGRIISGIRQVLPDFRDRGGFSDAFSGQGETKGDLMTDTLCSFFCAFQRKKPDLTGLTASLIGMGYGLTPSGDDFLVGLLCFLHISGWKAQKCTEEMTDVILNHLHRTSDLSGQFLKHACRGQFGEPFHELVRAVRTGGDGMREIRKIAEIGHSSGVDALNGMVAGWCMQKAAEENKLREVEQ